jgi:hypothetical protein
MSASVFERDRSETRPGSVERGGHAVEFYADDAQIIGKLTRYIAPALDSADEVAMVIATPRHRSALDGELYARGIDVLAAARDGRYIALDAATTLARFLVDGQPDPDGFADVVGGTIAAAQAGGRFAHVRAYGEMVALLWLAGRPDAALALERMWNDLARERSFTLLCGYATSGFEASQAAEIAEVGRTHTQIGPMHAFARSAAIR